MAHLYIQLLASFQLHYADQVVEGLSQSRVQSLLAYLLLNRDTLQSRQHLAFLLWPDSSETQARTNLRVLLTRLRRSWPAVEQFIHIERHTLHWQSGNDVSFDVSQFRDALAEAAAATGEAAIAALQQAVDRYSGDLLPDHYDEWVLAERERLHQDYLVALERLSHLLAEARRYSEAIQAGERLLRADPLREATYRRLMELHALADDRAAALHVYHACVTTLERELGVEPAEATKQIHERLLNRTQSAPAPARRHTEATPLVGRQQMWKQLVGTWRQVAAGPSRLALIWGEAGIGKSRLAEELVDFVRRQGYITVGTRSYAAEGALAYTPVADWLRSDPLRSGLQELDPIWQVEIARLVPELLTARSNLPAPGPLQESWQRRRFYEALARAVGAASQPLLLHLDDLQWTDAETLEWLHVALRFPDLHLLLVGTARVEEVGSDHPLHTLLHPLRRHDQLVEIELGPLNEEETAALAEQTAGMTLDSDVQAQFWHESEGHPLFLVEKVRARGDLLGLGSAGSGSPIQQPTSNAQLPVLPKIHAVITARLSLISTPARGVAELAAVVGRAFGYTVLRTLHAPDADTDEDALVQALDELWQRRIVREQEDGYDFSHDLVREVIYAGISMTRRRLLHRRVAEALTKLHADALETVSGELAVHYERSGDREQAYACYLRAGAHALSSYVPRQALVHYRQALAVAQTPLQQARAQAGLGRAYFSLDRLDQAREAFQQGLVHADAQSDLRGELCYAVADVLMAQYRADAAEPWARQALAAAEAAEDWETVCQALSLLGQIESQSGDLAAEPELIDRALTIARNTGNHWREGRTLADLAFLLAQQADFDAAAGAAQRALDLLAHTDDRAGIAFAWNMLGRAVGGRGDYSLAFAAFQQSETIAKAIEHRTLLAQIPNMRGWLHAELCDYSRACELDSEGMALARRWGKRTAEISARLNLCLDRLHLGQARQALVDLEAIEPHLAGRQYGYHAWRWRLRLLHMKGLCHLDLGEADQALALAEEGLTLALSTGAQKYVALNRQLNGRAFAQQNLFAQACDQLAQAVALGDRIQYQPLRWQARFRLAQIHRQSGEPERAAALVAEAAQVVRTIAANLDDEKLRRVFLSAALVCTVLAEDADRTAP